MRKIPLWLLLMMTCWICSCAVSKNYNPGKKFPKAVLAEDYQLLRKVLEDKHPALYWYTPKDSMNYYFDSLENSIADSMTEQQFGWKILAPLAHKIRCGHTSFGMSKNWYRYVKERKTPAFPHLIKLCGDTMVVTGNLNRKDSLIKRGDIITSINGLRTATLVKQMFQYLPLDGYAENVNYIRLSSNFPHYHRNIYGIYRNYRVAYIDSSGAERTTLVPMFNPAPDSAALKKKKPEKRKKVSPRKRKKEAVINSRSLEIDTASSTATMYLHTFSNGEGRHLKQFFRSSFRTMRRQQLRHLVIDLRSNGGGDVSMYVKLTRYIRNTPFKVADSTYAISRGLAPYNRVFKHAFFKNLGMKFITKKQRDGNYHFGYWERHWYQPVKKNHFDGSVYVLTNGPTFSASTLFCNAVKGQANVKLVGEETGGGWHGNSGIWIPDITLPNTRLRMRLPLFKIVQFNHVEKNGSGVIPDITIPPTVEAVRNNQDRKMRLVEELIEAANEQAKAGIATGN